MINKIKERGFTLIELLVVIAIIGILAAVVLASLNDARRSGNDAALKQSMASVRSQAEIHYNTAITTGGATLVSPQFSYANLCNQANITQLLSSIFANSPATGTTVTAIGTGGSGVTQIVCHATPTEWAVTAPLQAGQHWCVDSTGKAQNRATPLAANITAC